MVSIHARLLAAVTLVLAAFLGLTGWALDRAFHESALVAVRDRLQAQIYALLAAADLDGDGNLLMPDALPEPRFSTPGSGMYGRVAEASGALVWRSPSMVGLDGVFPMPEGAGVFRFDDLLIDGAPHLGLSFRVVWESESGAGLGFIFSVAESAEAFDDTIGGFRGSLWGWLGGLAAILLLLQGSIVRWGLRPLRRVAEDLRAIESGDRSRLEGEYPRELRGLTDNLNALIAHDKARLERYRNALGDLAHSLKTPLAVIHGIAARGRIEPGDLSQLGEQARRMNQIVEYQLQRAATSGPATLTSMVHPRSIVDRLLATLGKVYADKPVQVLVDVADAVTFHGEAGDLLELLGNLLDNAYKCCRRRIEIHAHTERAAGAKEGSRGAGLHICVADDGPGIALDLTEKVLERGMRTDRACPGQGIGLAVVREIVEAYGGRLEIGTSALGGARICVLFPEG